MKVLIHDERSDALDFLHGSIVNHGYEASVAKNGQDIINMLSDDRYSVVLTNGGYGKLDAEHLTWLKSASVFVIGISDKQHWDENLDLKVDFHLRRPFESSKLWQTLLRAKKSADKKEIIIS